MLVEKKKAFVNRVPIGDYNYLQCGRQKGIPKGVNETHISL